MRLTKTMPGFALAITLLGSPLWLPGTVAAEGTGMAVVNQTEGNTLAGQIVGVSKKAKTISIKIGQVTEMVKFSDSTKGMDFAEKGESAIIQVTMENGEKMAVEVKQKLAKLPAGTTEIMPEDVISIVKDGTTPYTLVDSRPAKRFAEASIPTAVSIPADVLKEKGESLLPTDKGELLIFYCGGPTCGLSPESASVAVKAGYTNVKVMIKGLPGWKKSGKMAVAAMDFVKKGNAIIIDLRPVDEATKGGIPRAVNIPFAQFEGVKGKLPKVKSAPFILYGSADEEKKAIKLLAEWGYKTASIVNGGLAGWVKAGGELTTGGISSEIHYAREMEKGEIGVDEFRQVLANGSSNSVVLDVRTEDEVEEGAFPGAVSIPLDQISKRMGELPKEKEILVHCTAGDRASMAADQLRKAGYKVRHLMAGVECAEGKCVISE